jgi:hypothetical protein
VKLWPFFCFYGGKWRVGLHYPKPEHAIIIEPFAGAAGYSLRYPDRQVYLCDADPIIAGLWQFLIRATVYDIATLPDTLQHIDEIQAPQEAKWLVGFWLNKATTAPCKTPSAWMRSGIRPNSQWGPAIKRRIISQLPAIRHWQVRCGDYADIPNARATWFVDPPYDNAAGQMYRCRFTDYTKLANWCVERNGQLIVCENAGATWLPFVNFRKIKSTEGKHGKAQSHEVIYAP